MTIFSFFNAPVVIVILAKIKQIGILAAQNMEFVAELTVSAYYSVDFSQRR